MKRALVVALISLSCSRADVDRGERPQPEPEINECGGLKELVNLPNDPCGACGLYTCDGQDAVRCADPGLNACGKCGVVPTEECNGRDDNCDGVVDEKCVVRVSTLPSNDTVPRISGNHVVFQAQSAFTNTIDVAITNVATATTKLVSPHSDPPGSKDDSSYDRDPSIDGNRAVWIERKNEPFKQSGQLVVYDVSTGKSQTLTTRFGAHPVVSGNRIAFESDGTSEWESDVWVFDFSTGLASVLTDKSTDDRAPDIDGEWLVYTRGSGASSHFNRHIVARNLATKEVFIPSNGLSGWHTTPAISGSWIVWRQEEGTQSPEYYGTIWAYNLSTQQRTKLSAKEAAPSPRVSGTRVCWTKRTLNGDSGIVLYDLATSREVLVSTRGTSCDIDGSRMVWTETNLGSDIYMRELAKDEP